MEENEIKENVELMIQEVDPPIDKAKFIISNVYYYIRNFYNDKYINPNRNNFMEYLDSFKNKLGEKNITNTFSFNLLKKYICGSGFKYFK